MRSDDRFVFCQGYDRKSLEEYFDAIMYVFDIVDLNKSIACDGYSVLKSGILFTCSVNTSNIPMDTIYNILANTEHKIGKITYKVEPYVLNGDKINIKMCKI